MEFAKPMEARRIGARSRSRNLAVRVYVVDTGNCYYTRSRSEADVIYHITRERSGWHCKCPGFTYTGCC